MNKNKTHSIVGLLRLQPKSNQKNNIIWNTTNNFNFLWTHKSI